MGNVCFNILPISFFKFFIEMYKSTSIASAALEILNDAIYMLLIVKILNVTINYISKNKI